jgi:hypothetical protein
MAEKRDGSWSMPCAGPTECEPVSAEECRGVMGKVAALEGDGCRRVKSRLTVGRHAVSRTIHARRTRAAQNRVCARGFGVARQCRSKQAVHAFFSRAETEVARPDV